MPVIPTSSEKSKNSKPTKKTMVWTLDLFRYGFIHFDMWQYHLYLHVLLLWGDGEGVQTPSASNQSSEYKIGHRNGCYKSRNYPTRNFGGCEAAPKGYIAKIVLVWVNHVVQYLCCMYFVYFRTKIPSPPGIPNPRWWNRDVRWGGRNSVWEIWQNKTKTDMITKCIEHIQYIDILDIWKL